jgi:hypothetical protein
MAFHYQPDARIEFPCKPREAPVPAPMAEED